MTPPTAYEVAGDANGNPVDRRCGHLASIADVTPRTPGECEDCIREGTKWLHLRLCLECGQVACCNSSPERHASKHAATAQHAIARSLEPGEEWAWCFPDELFLLPVDG